MSLPYAFVCRVEAKPEKADELAELLRATLPIAQAETGTVHWFALRTSETSFWVIDTFGSERARQDHIKGQIARTLLARAGELLVAPPEILPADVLASKQRSAQTQA
jgi:quinol monooxygenase YgiN